MTHRADTQGVDARHQASFEFPKHTDVFVSKMTTPEPPVKSVPTVPKQVAQGGPEPFPAAASKIAIKTEVHHPRPEEVRTQLVAARILVSRPDSCHALPTRFRRCHAC